MAAGDIKGQEAIVVDLVAGEAIAVGQVVNNDKGSYYNICNTGEIGKFAVAVTAASGVGDGFRAVIWGPVEVAASPSCGGIAAFVCVKAGPDGTIDLEAWLTPTKGETIGTSMSEFRSNELGTVWIGLVG